MSRIQINGTNILNRDDEWRFGNGFKGMISVECTNANGDAMAFQLSPELAERIILGLREAIDSQTEQFGDAAASLDGYQGMVCFQTVSTVTPVYEQVSSTLLYDQEERQIKAGTKISVFIDKGTRKLIKVHEEVEK